MRTRLKTRWVCSIREALVPEHQPTHQTCITAAGVSRLCPSGARSGLCLPWAGSRAVSQLPQEARGSCTSSLGGWQEDAAGTHVPCCGQDICMPAPSPQLLALPQAGEGLLALPAGGGGTQCLLPGLGGEAAAEGENGE